MIEGLCTGVCPTILQVQSVITAKQVEDTQLGDETNRFWQEILDRYYVFDRQEKEVGTYTYTPLCHHHHLPGIVVNASTSRAADGVSIPTFSMGIFQGWVIPVT